MICKLCSQELVLGDGKWRCPTKITIKEDYWRLEYKNEHGYSVDDEDEPHYQLRDDTAFVYLEDYQLIQSNQTTFLYKWSESLNMWRFVIEIPNLDFDSEERLIRRIKNALVFL